MVLRPEGKQGHPPFVMKRKINKQPHRNDQLALAVFVRGPWLWAKQVQNSFLMCQYGDVTFLYRPHDGECIFWIADQFKFWDRDLMKSKATAWPFLVKTAHFRYPRHLFRGKCLRPVWDVLYSFHYGPFHRFNAVDGLRLKWYFSSRFALSSRENHLLTWSRKFHSDELV